MACAYDRLEGDAHTNTIRLWLIGSGEALAACLDGRTGYVGWFFELDGRCGGVCVRGSVRRAEKRCEGSNLAAIQVCCCGFAKVIGWRMTKGGRLCRTSLKGWLVKHFLKAEPTKEALL